MQEVLNIDCSSLKGLIECAKEIGWWIPYSNAVFVSNKPKTSWKLLGDRRVLHGDGQPAIYYNDHFKIYAFNGVQIPEDYGSVPSAQWKPEWLLAEQNAEVRRVLIQGMGYERIMTELEGQKISVWEGSSFSPESSGAYREVLNIYELWRVAKEVDVEPLHLLKMICPSTGHTHVGRVPPDITSAFEAAKWRNHGIAPTEFAVQS